MNRLRRQTLLAAAAMLATPVASVHAQAGYPDRPVRIVIPFGAGSATDILTRAIAEPLSRALGQPVIVDNKPGGNSALGTGIVAKAAPDGYTLLLASNAGIVGSPAGMADVNYDPIKELSYITLVGAIQYVLVVNNAFDPSVKTAKDFIEHVKRNPGKYNYGSGNTGAIAYMGYIAKEHGLQVTHVPYKSSPPAVLDLMGNQIQMMVLDVSTAAPRIREGKLRALGMPTPKRHPLLPDVPTFAEQGLSTPPDMSGWWAFIAPAGTPEPILDRLNAEMVKILKDETIRQNLLNAGITIGSSTREEATRYHREQMVLWTDLIKQMNLRAN